MRHVLKAANVVNTSQERHLFLRKYRNFSPLDRNLPPKSLSWAHNFGATYRITRRVGSPNGRAKHSAGIFSELTIIPVLYEFRRHSYLIAAILLITVGTQVFGPFSVENQAAPHDMMDVDSFSNTNEKDSFKYAGVKSMQKRYSTGRVIGEGSFATVRIASKLGSSKPVAIKEINKSLSDQESLEGEIRVMRELGIHRNIVSLLDVFESETSLYLVMELAEGGELFEKIIDSGELNEKLASRFMSEAAEGLNHMHTKRIIHLDIKPENLLLTSTDDSAALKLADFGLAVQLPDENTRYRREECVGTPAYWSPELVQNRPFGREVDIWALGCVLYILLCGSHPFDPFGDAPEEKILKDIVDGRFDSDNVLYERISPEGKDLLRHMLDPNPKTRYTAKQILKHPWVTEAEEELSEKPLPKTYITKLKAFRAIQLLRFGVPELLSDPNACSKMFHTFDTNNDGYLTKTEISKALREFGMILNTKELDEIIKVFDTNNDGRISEKEFEAVLQSSVSYATKGAISRKRNPRTVRELKALFDIFDRDRDGYITKADCAHVLRMVGSSQTKTLMINKIKGKSISESVDFSQFVEHYRAQEKQTKGQIARQPTLHMRKGSIVTKPKVVPAVP